MNKLLAIPFLFFCLPLAQAHVSLESPIAETGSAYRAVLRVGHACDGSPTRSLSVQLPAGFERARPQAKAGWSLDAQSGRATWVAQSRDAMLADKQTGDFAIEGMAPRAAGPLWFKVRQECEQGSRDWADVPSRGTSTAGMKTPAVLLEVLAPRDFALARNLPKVEGAWIRPTVPGQQGTGGFMRLTAGEAMDLVAVESPAAGSAEVHEMKMEGDIMRMRRIEKLELPAGKPVELKPGGHHLMLLDLKQPLAKDTHVPLTLTFRNARGSQARLALRVPVLSRAPGAGEAAAPAGHKH